MRKQSEIKQMLNIVQRMCEENEVAYKAGEKSFDLYLGDRSSLYARVSALSWVLGIDEDLEG